MHFKKQLSFRIFEQFHTIPRDTSVATFLNQCKFANPLVLVPGWHPDRIVFCEMHVVHLGICQWVNACGIHLLSKFGYLGDVNDGLQQHLTNLTGRLNQWCALNRIRHYQPYIPLSVIAVKPGDYPELRLKAWTSRLITAFLSVALQDLCNNENDQRDPELALATVATSKLAEWMLWIENCPRYMSQDQASTATRLSQEILGLFRFW